MQKILVGWLVLLALAFAVGIITHWLIGLAVIAVPVVMTYVHLKLSPAYRTATAATMTDTLGK